MLHSIVLAMCLVLAKTAVLPTPVIMGQDQGQGRLLAQSVPLMASMKDDTHAGLLGLPAGDIVGDGPSGGMQDAVADFTDTVKDVLTEGGLHDVINDVASSAHGANGNVMEHIAETMSSIQDDASPRGASRGRIGKAMGGVSDDRLDDIVDKKSDILDGVKDRRDDMLDTVQDRRDDILDTVQDRRDDILDTVQDRRDDFNDKKDDIMDNIKDRKDDINDKKDDILDDISDKKDDIRDDIRDKKDDILDDISDKRDDIMDGISDKKDDIMDDISDKKDDIMDDISDKKDDILDDRSDNKDDILDDIRDKKDDIFDDINDKNDDISGEVSDSRSGDIMDNIAPRESEKDDVSDDVTYDRDDSHMRYDDDDEDDNSSEERSEEALDHVVAFINSLKSEMGLKFDDDDSHEDADSEEMHDDVDDSHEKDGRHFYNEARGGNHGPKSDEEDERVYRYISKMSKAQKYLRLMQSQAARQSATASGTCPMYPVSVTKDRVTVTTQNGCQIVINLKGAAVQSVEDINDNMTDKLGLTRSVEISYRNSK